MQNSVQLFKNAFFIKEDVQLFPLKYSIDCSCLTTKSIMLMVHVYKIGMSVFFNYITVSVYSWKTSSNVYYFVLSIQAFLTNWQIIDGYHADSSRTLNHEKLPQFHNISFCPFKHFKLIDKLSTATMRILVAHWTTNKALSGAHCNYFRKAL